MTARAIWKAGVRVGSERVGVRMYSAVKGSDIRFNLLHEKDGVRVRQRLVHPETGETVEPQQVRRGLEVERGVFVVLEEDELAKLESEPSRDIEVTRFVAPDKVDHRWYDRPYWLGPDEGEDEGYFALVAALEKTGREGIARWSMRKRDYVGALRADQGYLALIALRHASEVLPLADLQAPPGREITALERKLASQLVSALSAKFDVGEFKEEYRERVLELVEAKRKGKRIPKKVFRPVRVPDASLAEALRRSLKAA